MLRRDAGSFGRGEAASFFIRGPGELGVGKWELELGGELGAGQSATRAGCFSNWLATGDW